MFVSSSIVVLLLTGFWTQDESCKILALARGLFDE
jgi:hypothetical protein